MDGCTLPDDNRKQYPGYNQDKKNGYWHGGKIEINWTQKMEHLIVIEALLIKGDYRLAGVRMGCVLHAIQDIQAHNWNDKHTVVDKKNKEKTINDSEKFINNKNNFSNIDTMWSDASYSEAKAFANKFIEKKKGKFRLKDIGDKKFRIIHKFLSDNPYANFVNGKWKFYKKKSNNPRYSKSIDGSVEYLKWL